MTARQFVSSAVCSGLVWFSENFPKTHSTGRHFLAFVFPSFLWKAATVRRLPSSPAIACFTGLTVFLTAFVIQGVWAWLNGLFWPLPTTRSFLEDYPNLLNYVLICEIYGVCAVLFLINVAKLDSFAEDLGVPAHPHDPKQKGIFLGPCGLVIALLIAAMGSAGYATEIIASPTHYWFMDPNYIKPGTFRFSTAGYFYLFINFAMLCLVVTAGIAHAELFRVGGRIARYIRQVAESGDQEALKTWTDDSRLIERMLPFSRTVLISKVLVFFIILNIATWSWERQTANVGLMHAIGAIAATAFGIWIFALPRYAVQLEIFRAKMKLVPARQEYKDLRPVWLIGFSAVFDVLLFSYVLTGFIKADIVKLLDQFFS